MRKPAAILGSMLFFIAAPGSVAGLAPWLISGWIVQPPFLGATWLRGVGVALLVVGLAPLIDSFRRFAVEGLGTPAPIQPPERLIATGFYRHVRNPMYVGIVSLIVGQALMFSSAVLLAYAAAVWLGFHVFVTAYEEPALHRRFGADYDLFMKNVPRWIPRLTPWSMLGANE